MDSGCTTTLIFSTGMSNIQRASITSKPLFIMVEESMVTFAPMLQLGCLSAWAAVAAAICSLLQLRNGPPDAVRCIFSTAFPWAASRHWKMAECSESTGRMTAPCSRMVRVTRLPAATSVSLFARANILPASRAARVGFSPLKPTMAPTTMSTSSAAAREHRLSMPANTLLPLSFSPSATMPYLSGLQTTTLFTSNSLAWEIRSSALLLAEISSTSKRSLCWRTMSRVWVPMEPVEPSIAIFLFTQNQNLQ